MDTEVQEFLELLDGVKSNVRDFVNAIGDDGVTWSSGIPDTNSVAVIITHMFGSEAEAIQEFVGGAAVNRDRDSEFARPRTTVEELVDLIDRVSARTREVVSKETRETLDRLVRTREPGQMKTARGTLIQALTHQAEHVGHMQLTDQLRLAQRA